MKQYDCYGNEVPDSCEDCNELKEKLEKVKNQLSEALNLLDYIYYENDGFYGQCMVLDVLEKCRVLVEDK